jgi:hypothetical protein
MKISPQTFPQFDPWIKPNYTMKEYDMIKKEWIRCCSLLPAEVKTKVTNHMMGSLFEYPHKLAAGILFCLTEWRELDSTDPKVYDIAIMSFNIPQTPNCKAEWTQWNSILDKKSSLDDDSSDDDSSDDDSSDSD